MLDPYALQKFVKYTFENWNGNPPSFVVLFGDMSYDYRKLLKSSRENYIPSIPYKAITYGQISSDNAIAAVAGDDAALRVSGHPGARPGRLRGRRHHRHPVAAGARGRRAGDDHQLGQGPDAARRRRGRARRLARQAVGSSAA